MASFAIPIGISIASLISGMLGAGGKKTTGTQQGSSTQTTAQTLEPKYGEMQDLMIQNLIDRMQSPVPIAGYEASGLDAINKTWGAAAQRNQNELSARGLLESPIASLSNEQLNASRAGEQAAWINKMPLLQREMQLQDLQATLAALSSAPRTSQQWGSTSGSTTGTQTATSPFAEGLQDMSMIMAYLYGQGAFGGKKTGSPGSPGSSGPDWSEGY